MKKITSKPNELWYVDSRASNHVMSHDKWFSYLEKPKQLGVVETGDDTSHPIEHVSDVSLTHVRQNGRLMNMLCVLMITKNLVSVSQIVNQGIQVWFTHLRCFIEE